MKLRSCNEVNGIPSTMAQTTENPTPKPSRLLVLPANTSAEAWITEIPKARDESSSAQYICCPTTGAICELIELNTDKKNPRSWLLALQYGHNSTMHRNANGHVIDNPALFVATPIDPLFLFLPVLMPVGSEKSNDKRLVSIHDYEDFISATSPEWRYVLQHEKLNSKILQRLKQVCHQVMAGDETMYRLSMDKVAAQVISKAEKIAKCDLPKSIEAEFVQKALQLPVADKETKDMQKSEAADEGHPQHGGEDENSISDNTITNEKSGVLSHLMRLRVATDLVLTYVEPHLKAQISASWAKSSTVDYTPLEEHVTHVQSLKQEATALRALSDNISRKRPAMDEMLEAKAEKKRKKEEEERKKKLESRGVKDLKKVNTSGMMKLNTFFRKAG